MNFDEVSFFANLKVLPTFLLYFLYLNNYFQKIFHVNHEYLCDVYMNTQAKIMSISKIFQID